MELKKYQKLVINDLNRYMELLNEKQSVSGAYNEFWSEKNIPVGFGGIPQYNNTIKHTPHVCFKVPTGGGKTFLACNSLKTIFSNLPFQKTKVVVWLVPSEAILSQTIRTLTDASHPYRQKINADFNSRVMVYTKQQVLDGQQFNPTTVNEQLSIVVMSFDSFRIKNKDGRKVYQENGNLQQFAKFQKSPETLIDGVDDTALVQVLNQLSPIIVVDESHHTIGELSVEMLTNLNPCFILDLTATPRKNSNIISYVDAMQLKRENMVKLPVIVYNRPSQEEVVTEALDLRNKLEEEAIKSQAAGGKYIRPIVLFQAQPKIADNKETFEKLKAKLIGCGIPAEQIAIKTAEINEIKNQDLMSDTCKIRYIITVNALKEGWDCPFAYILATLANKTSSVDVEQILGRILRLPYTTQNANKYLNLSYVLTSSADFHATLEKIIKGLNDAGFSKQDYRIIEQAVVEQTRQQVEQLEITDKNETQDGVLNLDDDKIKELLSTRIEKNGDNTLAAMLENAAEKSNAYEKNINENEEEGSGLAIPLELKTKMNEFEMYEQFREKALAIKFPQFFIEASPSLFSDSDMDLLTPMTLADGFTLKDKSTEINFASATDNVYKVDAIKNDNPKYTVLSCAESGMFKEFIDPSPLKSRINGCKWQIKLNLENLDYIASSELTAYIDRIVENMDSDTLAALEKNVYGFAKKIKEKIEGLLNKYQKHQFDKMLELGKIVCKPSFTFAKTIHPLNSFSMLSKSLYTEEGEINQFEQRIIERVSALPNIVWWHRNIARVEFAINGNITHFPDFIIYTQSEKVVLIETKGNQLLTNDESKEKAELGKIWQNRAGDQFRYYMINEGDTSNNTNAISVDRFLDIVKEL